MGRPGLTQHRKFRRLARLLNDEARALGCLEFMWIGAYESGDPYLGDSDDVESACRWRGKAGALCGALLDAGFIEPADNVLGHYQIHDLYDHAPDYVQKRMEREAARRERGETISDVRRRAANARHARANGPQVDASDLQTSASDLQVDASDGRLHANDLQTDATVRTPAPAPAPAPEALKDSCRPRRSANTWALSEAVEAAYRRYPRKLGKAEGMDELRKQLHTEDDVARFAAAVENYARSVAGKEPEYIKHFSTFVKKRRWEDYAPGAPALVEAVDPHEAEQAALAEESRRRRLEAVRREQPWEFDDNPEAA